jgi:UDP-3-O-[3-hydroxymyristoyl] N-acetylglucosamine deacetylase
VHSATLSSPITIRGRGLFSGADCTARVLPADPGTGLTFVVSGAAIPCTPEHFLEQPSCTVLAAGGAQVAVVEHLLCALWAAGIDTATIEVDGPELPNQDGSALPLYETLLAGGRVEHGLRPRLELGDTAPTVEADGSFIQITLSERQGICYSFSHPELGEQRFMGPMDRETAPGEILPARSFITEREAAAAQAAGFLLNDREEDALIWRSNGKGQLSPVHTLRFANELARHKVLDFIGDLYVLPFEWSGTVTAYRSGHRLNRELARKLYAIWQGGAG